MATIDDLEAYAEERKISFTEAMDRYAIVSANYDPVHGSYVVMTERDPGMTQNFAISELGYASPSPFTSWTRDERVPELRDRVGLRTYYDMKRADGTVRGALRLLKTPIMAARWFVEPASDSSVDKNIAKFVENNLFKELNVPWSRVVEDALLMCEFGYFPFEKVYHEDGGKIKLQKLGPRHPLDVQEWDWDSNGGPRGIIMDPFQGSIMDRLEYTKVFIPIEKLVVFVLEQEAGDLRGVSILRSAYKHYYYKDCKSADTEILTKRGWLTHDQILPGDETLSINPETGLSEWDEIQYVKRYPGTHDMILMEGRQFSSLSTTDHRWLTKFKGKWRWTTTEKLTHDDNIPRVMPCVTLPAEPKYTDEFVELVAWLWTEGCVQRSGGFKISQSERVNHDNVLKIRRALQTLCPNPIKGDRYVPGDYWSERIQSGRSDIREFYIGTELSKEFWNVLDKHKIVKPSFIVTLTAAQLKLFVDTSILGDGYGNPKAGEPVIVQENQEQLVAIQMACTLLGIPTSIRKYKPDGYSERWHLTLLNKMFVNPRCAASLAQQRGYKDGMRISHVTYSGIIWCPKTKNGTWLAKRKGSIYTTGNTLYKIDAIQKERHGIGIPIILLPPGYSVTDKKAAEDLGRNLRTNERAHIVAPNNWQISFAEIKVQPVNCMQSIEHHDMKIKSNILAPFMDEANVHPDSLDVYFKSTRYIASTVCDTFNHFVIPQLVDFNFKRGSYPKLRVRRIGEWEDVRTMSFAFRNFVGAGAIQPDDNLEEFLRSELDLPPVDKSSIRTVPTPQIAVGQGAEQQLKGAVSNKPQVPLPPDVGLPRQAPPSANLPRKNAGIDTSGGR